MNKSQLFSKLEEERAELNRMIDEALENGTPISQTQEIIDQSKKVDDLIEIVQKEMSKTTIRER